MSDLNPSIRELIYGKKELKKLTLYPLSVGDQFKLTELVTKVVQRLVAAQKENSLNDLAFMASMMESLEENLAMVISLISDVPPEEAKEVISRLTNSQLADLIESIWETDYEPMLKKSKNLYERGKNLFNSRKQSPVSLNPIPNTD